MSVFLEIAEDVLTHSKGEPLSVHEIWLRATEWDIIPDSLQGKTPIQTLKSKLSVDIRKRGHESLFVRVGPGRFCLRADLGGRREYHAPRAHLPGSAREMVAVFPSSLLTGRFNLQGILDANESMYDALFNSGHIRYVERWEAETRFDVKQVITYVVVRCGRRVLSFRRGSHTRVESYLKGSRCVGFGGHVSASDAHLFSADEAGVADSAIRELKEELHFPEEHPVTLDDIRLAAFINDDSSETGRRHFAVVFEYEINEPAGDYWNSPRRGERATTRLEWVDLDHPVSDLSEFEYWSQLVMRKLYGSSIANASKIKFVHRAPWRRPHVLCVVGPIGSGKSEAVAELTRQHGYVPINSGAAIADLLGVAPVPVTRREEFQELADDFISVPSGPERLAKALAAEAPNEELSYVIDGIRQLATLRSLIDALSGRRVAVLYVMTPPDIAFTFFRSRERSNATAEEFYRLRNAPVEQEVPSLLVEADAVIYNWRGASRYRRIIRQLFEDVKTG